MVSIRIGIVYGIRIGTVYGIRVILYCIEDKPNDLKYISKETKKKRKTTTKK